MSKEIKTVYSKIISNVGTEDITIREIGLFVGFSNSLNDVFLFDRTVLKEPVIIKPGETKTIQYTIDYSNI